jgi:cytidylate kinase
MNISITGNLGSGKSSICKILREKGFDIISAGTIFRDLAKENQMSVEEFNQKINEDIQKGDRSVDDLIDRRTTQIDQERDNVVFDSRLAWHFAPRSFKVFVAVDIEEAARRVYEDAKRADSESYASVEECRDALLHRQEMESQRFWELYQINYFDRKNYDLVIESTFLTPQEVVDRIIVGFQDYQQSSAST